MSNLQEVFIRIQETKKKQKEIKSIIRDAFDSSVQYKKIQEELKELRDKKKEIEVEIRHQLSSEYTQLDDLKIDLDTDNEMLSDLAINQLMKGETVKVNDAYENEYEPIFRVNFKKI